MFTEARSNPDEQKYIVGAEIVSFAPKLVEIGGESRGDRPACGLKSSTLQSVITIHLHTTKHFASKTYVMINTVILSSIFDYLYLLFYCELEPQILCAHKNRSREKNAKIDGIGD